MKLLWLEEKPNADEGMDVQALFRTDDGHALLQATNHAEWTDGWNGSVSTDFETEEPWDLLADLYGVLYGENCPVENKERTHEIERILGTLVKRYETD